jgi:hypothetical protein
MHLEPGEDGVDGGQETPTGRRLLIGRGAQILCPGGGDGVGQGHAARDAERRREATTPISAAAPARTA